MSSSRKTTTKLIEMMNVETTLDDYSPQEYVFLSKQFLIFILSYLSAPDMKNILYVTIICSMSKIKSNNGSKLNHAAIKDRSDAFSKDIKIQKEFDTFYERQHLLVDNMLSIYATCGFYSKLPPINLYEEMQTHHLEEGKTWKTALDERILVKKNRFNDDIANRIFILLFKKEFAKIKIILNSPEHIKCITAKDSFSKISLWLYLHHYGSQSLLDFIYESIKNNSAFSALRRLHAALLCKQPTKVILDLKPNKDDIVLFHYDSTPLFIAALDNRVDLIRFFLEMDNALYKRHDRETGQTMLQVAAQHGHIELTDLIFEHLKENEKLSYEEIKEHVCLPEISEIGNTAWEYALALPTTGKIAEKISGYIDDFNRYPIIPGDMSNDLDHPLLVAARRGHPHTLTLLLNKNMTMSLGRALQTAVSNDRLMNSRILINEIDSSTLNENYLNLLYQAIKRRNMKMIKLLLQHKADDNKILLSPVEIKVILHYVNIIYPDNDLRKEKVTELITKRFKDNVPIISLAAHVIR